MKEALFQAYVFPGFWIGGSRRSLRTARRHCAKADSTQISRVVSLSSETVSSARAQIASTQTTSNPLSCYYCRNPHGAPWRQIPSPLAQAAPWLWRQVVARSSPIRCPVRTLATARGWGHCSTRSIVRSASTSYGKRAPVESTIGRYKSIIGRRLRARYFLAERTEVALRCAVLSRIHGCAHPKSVRRHEAIA